VEREIALEMADAPLSTVTPKNTILNWQVSAIFICVVGALAYATSFKGVFIFDDTYYLVVNAPIVQSFSWDTIASPATISRPVIGLSLAFNYAISGMNPWSYHAFNLLVHLAAALALFGLVRRTLSSENLKAQFGDQSTFLALAIALIWAVHPLQTQSVTYIIQRCESVMGLCYLLTLYAAIRSFAAEKKERWIAAAIAACACGMLAKQVMVTAPVVVLIYDYLFVSDSLKAALNKHKNLYGGLAATWIVLAVVVMASPVNPTAGFAVQAITPFDYFKSQFQVIIYYFRLALFPNALCIDYAWQKAESLKDILPYAILVVGMQAATAWGVWRRKAISFLGVWFFGILAVTSSFMPFEDLIFEHRMYLPLAAIVTAVVLGSHIFGKHLIEKITSTMASANQLGYGAAVLLLTIIVALFGYLTSERNRDYQSEIAMWRDVIKKRPDNTRAYNNLGVELLNVGNVDEAQTLFSEAAGRKPDYAEAQYNLGRVWLRRGDIETGKSFLLKAVQIKPNYEDAHFKLGQAFGVQNNLSDAHTHFLEALKINPRSAIAAYSLGMVMELQGRFLEAAKTYDWVAQARPNAYEAYTRLAFILASQNDVTLRNTEGAVQLAQRAVQLTRNQNPVCLDALAVALAENRQFDEAVVTAKRALELASARNDEDLSAVLKIQIGLFEKKIMHEEKQPKILPAITFDLLQ
jgi:protein O-mannosyl-transferase